MQNPESKTCFHCRGPLRANAMRYLISDMADEMMAWVELKLKLAVTEHSCLCTKCFNYFEATWAAIQEPEVEVTQTAVQYPNDPLSASKYQVEEVEVKFDIPQTPEQYDYTIDIDESDTNVTDPELIEGTETNYNDEENNENMSCDDDDLIQEVMKVEKSSDSDEDEKASDSDEDELSSDGETDIVSNVSIIPPVLDGSKLKSGSKCDWCNTIVTNKEYRKLPNGPEKDYIVARTIYREKSPERVCNPCWSKAYKGTHSIIVLDSTKNLEETTNSQNLITLPSYKRVTTTSCKCIVSNCENSKRNRVPDYLRGVLLKSYNLFASDLCRICQEHSKEYHRDWSFLKEQQKNKTTFSAKDVTNMLDLLREEALKHPD